MRQIAVLEWKGHEIANDVKVGLTHLNRARIGAHSGQQEQGHGLLWVHEDSEIATALKLLRENGLEVVEKPY